MASKKDKYYLRPDGLYEAIRIIDGKRKAFRGHSPKEVERKMIDYRGELMRGRLFQEIADEWEASHFPTLAPNTIKGYQPALRRATTQFGSTPIRQIKAPDIKKFITEFSRVGNGQAQLAQKTVANQLLVIGLIMGYAAECGELEFNPCTNVSIPRALVRGHREAASSQDEAKVKASANAWLLPFLILYTGLRKGEALALTFGDIDYKTDKICVTKSVYHINNKPFLKMPKTAAGTRTVPILAPLKPKLPKMDPKHGRKAEHFIFSEDGGSSPLTEGQYQKLWKQYVEATGVQATAHQLRHSYATMLFECPGVELKDAQDLLGHATAAMTQDIYTHIRDSRRKETTQLINKELGKK